MIVKHKVSGKEFEVSEDYFEKYADKLNVLEVIKTTKDKTTKDKTTKKSTPKKTKVVTDEAPAIQGE